MVNKETGVPTGSAFVQFVTPSDAQKCLKASEAEGDGVECEGQILNLSLALPHSEVEKMRQDRSENREKEDKRNLYLAKEGG